jgi:dihydrofolate synthase/folylpolyglutamate synthase
MNYSETLKYIDSFINFEKISRYDYASSFKLERMFSFLELSGNPHKDLHSIHIAGSKGKGSVCAISAYMLKEAGYRVGLYTSPHLVDIRERIRILDGESEGLIEREEFIDLIEKIKPVAEIFRDHKTFGRISFFEVLTAAAFLYFRKMKVDIAVLETGLGGRLDATNVIQPMVCGITNISMEHSDKLGNAIRSIAREKAGIIKTGNPGCFVFSGKQDKEVMDEIKTVCDEKHARLLEVGVDVKYSITRSDENNVIFDLYGPGYSYKGLRLRLIGGHQAQNASLAIGMVKSIEKNGYTVSEEAVRSGLEKVSWPGRLQVISRDPFVIVDGAQNAASIKTILSSIKNIFKYDRLICILGISSDKDAAGIAGELNMACDAVILTRSKNTRAMDPVCLSNSFPFSRPGLEVSENLSEAMQKALKTAGEKDIILITGSLFLVGEAIESIGKFK